MSERRLLSAAIPLTAAGETVGMMFVNYRPQSLDPEQQDVIEALPPRRLLHYNARLFSWNSNSATYPIPYVK
ncbi:MAG: hypothetical protein U0401_16990 [Anaerolineae bacterium]